MKRVSAFLVIILLVVMEGCGGRSKQSTDSSETVDVIANHAEKEPTMLNSMDIDEITVEANDTLLNQSFVQDIIYESYDDIITVDVRRNYSSKKELILQDFMDVEYIVLETNDDFVNQGVVLDVGNEFMLVRNRLNDGDIFIYDRQGKALRKINHKGQGPEEYITYQNIILDEEKGEIFINNSSSQKIVVYDLYGNFKRSLKYNNEGLEYMFYTDIFNYDNDNLICYDEYNEEIGFELISKQNGSITKKIEISFKEKKVLMQTTPADGGGIYVVGPAPRRSIIPFKGNWILSEVSSDTVYSFLTNYSLRPFIVRIPSVQSMTPEVMLTLRVLSDRYYFMEIVKNEYNFSTRTGFPTTYFMYDRQEKAFWGYTLYNGDFSTKKELYLNRFTPVNHEVESWNRLEAYQLVESYKNGELKDGRLKDIAAKLDAEDNPVIMLIKHK